VSGRFDARAYERWALELLRKEQRKFAADLRHEQDSTAVSIVTGILRSVAESEQGARRTAKEAAVVRALVTFHAEVWN
jgi:hypothetical protein